MKRTEVGEYRTNHIPGESFLAFIPAPLPPQPPLLLEEPRLQLLLERANRALGRLDGMTLNAPYLPDTSFFIYLYLRKEAVLSAQIEGSQSTLTDLLLFELDRESTAPLDDITEASTYVKAINYGLERIRSGFPFSSRLMKEVHGVLLAEGRGSTKNPGEFRRSQNWIGGTRPGNAIYVPPPSDEIGRLISELEAFYHQSADELPLLVRIALVHARFETIHPFLDGNGRLGRQFITLLLCAEGVLEEPFLYLSLYLKHNREVYYALLQQLRTTGDWESWLEFFLTGIKETAQRVVETVRLSLELFAEDQEHLKRTAGNRHSCHLLHQAFLRQPYLTGAKAAEMTELAYPTIYSSFELLVKEGLIQEITGRRRNRIYVYTRYFTLLNEGVEP
ncbi:MAG: Fic family protein [Candidatus Coatesbacteria bacterium]|nr:Fic family protein [Candidatus Coatesbacteria bacterium]